MDQLPSGSSNRDSISNRYSIMYSPRQTRDGLKQCNEGPAQISPSVPMHNSSPTQRQQQFRNTTINFVQQSNRLDLQYYSQAPSDSMWNIAPVERSVWEYDDDDEPRRGYHILGKDQLENMQKLGRALFGRKRAKRDSKTYEGGVQGSRPASREASSSSAGLFTSTRSRRTATISSTEDSSMQSTSRKIKISQPYNFQHISHVRRDTAPSALWSPRTDVFNIGNDTAPALSPHHSTVQQQIHPRTWRFHQQEPPSPPPRQSSLPSANSGEMFFSNHGALPVPEVLPKLQSSTHNENFNKTLCNDDEHYFDPISSSEQAPMGIALGTSAHAMDCSSRDDAHWPLPSSDIQLKPLPQVPEVEEDLSIDSLVFDDNVAPPAWPLRNSHSIPCFRDGQRSNSEVAIPTFPAMITEEPVGRHLSLQVSHMNTLTTSKTDSIHSSKTISWSVASSIYSNTQDIGDTYPNSWNPPPPSFTTPMSPFSTSISKNPSEESWEDVIDYCYKHAAESNSNFDWQEASRLDSLEQAMPDVFSRRSSEGSSVPSHYDIPALSPSISQLSSSMSSFRDDFDEICNKIHATHVLDFPAPPTSNYAKPQLKCPDDIDVGEPFTTFYMDDDVIVP